MLMHIFSWLYISIHVCTYMFMFTSVHTCMRLLMLPCIYLFLFACIYLFMLVYICSCLYLFLFTSNHAYICSYLYGWNWVHKNKTWCNKVRLNYPLVIHMVYWHLFEQSTHVSYIVHDFGALRVAQKIQVMGSL